MDTPRTNGAASSAPGELPHRTDGDDGSGARRAAEAEAVRRAADRPSHPAIDGEQAVGPPRAPAAPADSEDSAAPSKSAQ
jgi:hypothetical protein